MSRWSNAGQRVAATDSFFIHLRLLIEFLTKKPNLTHPAIHRDDYASGFNLSFVDLAMYRRLKTDFDFAASTSPTSASTAFRQRNQQALTMWMPGVLVPAVADSSIADSGRPSTPQADTTVTRRPR